jgi:multicopper oxidase
MESHSRAALSRGSFLKYAGAGIGVMTVGDLGLAHATGLLDRGSQGGVSLTLDVGPMHANLGSRTVSTIGFNTMLPGPELRLTEGGRVEALVRNHLAQSTSVHWHGIPIINRMDGVPALTQPPIAPNTSFQYSFKIPVSGTYWYHSHSFAQLDRGMYGPLIVQPKRETLQYDREYTIILDDWRDGVGKAGHLVEQLYECAVDIRGPEQHVAAGIAPGQAIEPTRYPYHLMNGRTAQAPVQLVIKRGDVVRLRIINAAAATTYRVALAGHRMRVVHADGQPVQPVDVDSLDIGMAERYDVLIYGVNPGVWQLAGFPSSPGPLARAVVRYQGHHGKAPPAKAIPATMNSQVLSYRMLKTAGGYGIPPSGKPDQTVAITLNSRFGAFYLTVNGQVADVSRPLQIARGSHVRFTVLNDSIQLHPMHLHGHFFQLANGTGQGPMKDTLIIAPSEQYTFDWVANNPGLWMYHCHNLYHMLNGLMHVVHVS